MNITTVKQYFVVGRETRHEDTPHELKPVVLGSRYGPRMIP